ncbi:MAG TPA: cytochrome c [Burkholderiaceae bacterium]|nr:cytochrome c [Burkholderiaceae bacterium]
MKKTTVTTAALLAFATGWSGLAAAADIEAGRQIGETQCAACHGKDGKSPIDPSYPKIAGQYADYLVKVLGDYQSGARKNPIMGGIAKPLSKADIENVAAFFNSLPGPLTHNK